MVWSSVPADALLLCELAQYDVSEEALEELMEKVGEDSLLGLKLHDIRLVDQACTERMGDTYMMAEELVPQLTRVVSSLEMMKHCVVCLDGFFSVRMERTSGDIFKNAAVSLSIQKKKKRSGSKRVSEYFAEEAAFHSGAHRSWQDLIYPVSGTESRGGRTGG